MNTLKILEEKITLLVSRIQELKKENAALCEENAQLTMQLKTLQESLQEDTQRISKLDEEKSLTKMVVDDLIKSIDSLVECER